MKSTIKASLASLALVSGMRRDPLSVQPGFEYDNTDFELKWYENQTLDHFNSNDDRQFRARYFVNDKYYKGDGPVFLYICGEWVCSPPSVNSSSAFALGSKLGARLVALEHRYYGQTQPFSNAEGGWSYENLKYLSAKQSLADIHQFINDMKADLGKDTQFVVIGGSYPGALSAWFKHVYPDDAVASWSSSGVINSIEDFNMFDTDIWLSSQMSGDACTQEIRKTTQMIDDLFESGSKDELHAMFKTLGNTNMDVQQGDFMFFVADIFTMGIQYGTRTAMCDYLLSDEYKKDPIGQLAAYAKTKGVEPADYDAHFMSNTTVDNTQIVRQWTYQYCTEFGWFQTPNPLVPTRSQSLKVDFWTDYCQRIFDKNIPAPAIEDSNSYFGGLNITGKNIFFLTASEDPWQYAGMVQMHDPKTQSKMASYHIECTDCGHCIDLHAPRKDDPESLTKGREMAQKQIVAWLKEDKLEKEKEMNFMQN